MEVLNHTKLYINWIDNNIYNNENMKYLKQLGYNNNNIIVNNHIMSEVNIYLPNINDQNLLYETEAFQNVESFINYLKNNIYEVRRFKETIIIVSGRLFKKFVKEFNKNLKYIYIIPKIIVFTKGNFSYPENIPNKEFYKYGGIKKTFNEIKNFIDSELQRWESYPLYNQSLSSDLIKSHINDELIFDPIKDSKELVLPMFYQILLDLSTIDNNKFINDLFEKYKNDENYVGLLNQIKAIPDIPIDLLSKYYIRMYTIEGDFYKKMKIELLGDNKENYKDYYSPYIKTLYKSLHNKALDQYIDKELYSAQLLSNNQINDLYNFKKNRINNLPMSNVFTKSFISFSKELAVAENFLNNGKKMQFSK